MSIYKNSKKQGDAGLGASIAYFTKVGYTVAVPLTDSQDYDLIIDNGQKLSRIQVKTCNFKRRSYEVNLSTKGGNRTSVGNVKKFKTENSDYLFVLADGSIQYLIPTKMLIAKYNLVLGPKYDEFIVK